MVFFFKSKPIFRKDRQIKSFCSNWKNSDWIKRKNFILFWIFLAIEWLSLLQTNKRKLNKRKMLGNLKRFNLLIFSNYNHVLLLHCVSLLCVALLYFILFLSYLFKRSIPFTLGWCLQTLTEEKPTAQFESCRLFRLLSFCSRTCPYVFEKNMFVIINVFET